MRAFTAKDVKNFLNTRQSKRKSIDYAKWEGDTTGRFYSLEKCFKMTDKLLNEYYFFHLIFPGGWHMFVRITDFEFKTYKDDLYSDYVYLIDDFSKQWQEYLAAKYPDYSYAINLKAFAEKNLKEIKDKYNDKKKEFMKKLKQDFKEEASPYLEMLDTANSLLGSDDKELN